MRKFAPALIGQALIALGISVTVAAFQARPGYFSTLQTTSTLTSASVASGDALIKTGDIIFSTTGACRTGFSEYTALRGRYVVGLPSGGTNEGTAGTALTNLESRPAGQHSHGVTDPGHTHTVTVTDPGHTHTIFGNNVNITSGGGDTALTSASLSGNSGSSVTGVAASANSNTTGLAVNNSTGTSGTAGTPAPYVQLIACKKN